jgi:transposase, IS5 family
MAHRRIGQGVFRFGTKAERQTSLDELGALIDWFNADRVLASLYKALKGEKAWPLLAMFKALLLATWYDLSDVALSEALSDRASFRRFCGFARDEATPERTAFVRFRRQLVEHGLDRSLFEAIALDLESQGAAVRKGTSPQLSITHKFCSDDGTQLDVHQAGQSPPHDHISGRWVVGASQIATKSGDLG